MELELEKTLLVIKAHYNQTTRELDYSWTFPDRADSTRLIGLLELVKQDLLRDFDMSEQV